MPTLTWDPYALIPIAAAVMSVAIGRYAWRWRRSPGGQAFAWLMFAAGEWALLSGVETLITHLPTKVFVAKLEYFGIASIAPLWLLFTLGYARPDGRPAARDRLALWIIPSLTVLFALTNEWHGWIWSAVVPASGGAGNLVVYHHGPWFYLAAAYSYVLLLAGSVMLIWAIWRSPPVFRRQAGTLLVGLAIPWVSNGLYLAGVPLVPGVDPTPLAFTLTGLIYAWSLYRLRLLDLTPVAWATVVHALPDGVIVLDEHRRVIDINPAAQSIIGRLGGQVIGQSLEAAWPASHQYLSLANPEAVNRLDLQFDAGNQPRHLELVVSRLLRRGAEPSGWTLVFHEVTERRRAEEALRQSREQLRHLAARQEAAREEERARIAYEIHDELGQELTAMRMALSQLAKSLPALDDHQAEQWRDLNELSNSLIRTVRRIATELRPVLLDDFGLVAALQHHFEEFTRRSGLAGRFITELETIPLSADAAIACYRIVQEALTNVARHARATEVTVQIESRDGFAWVHVTDNGRGMDLAAPAAAGHLGLVGMRERAALISATLLIASQPGQGTTVLLKAPLRAHAEAGDALASHIDESNTTGEPLDASPSP